MTKKCRMSFMEISLPKVDVKDFHITRIRWKNSCEYQYDITSLVPLEIITDYSNTSVKVLFTERYTWQNFCLKANVSQMILNWHSLRHSHNAEICMHFYCLS